MLHFLYHELSSSPGVYTYALDQSIFRNQLDFLYLSQGKRFAAKLTFDDGHASDYDIAFPMLAERGITAEFFLTANWIGKRSGYMGWSEVRALHASSQRIGAHGWSHKLFTHCSARELRCELVDAKKLLEDGLGSPVRSVSFPGGRFNQGIIEECFAAGYTSLFTSIPKLATVPSGPLTGRVNVRGNWTQSYFESLLDPEKNVLGDLERQEKLKGLTRKILGDTLYGWFWSAANRAGSARKASTDART